MASQENSPNAIETFSGRFVDIKSPDPKTIVLEDIAHAMAATARFGGHSRVFYSVAEHAVFCSIHLERQGASQEECLAALHHDDSEAYLMDVPRPFKPLLGYVYVQLSLQMDIAVVEGLGLPCSASALHAPAIKDADNYALMVEARELMPSKGAHWFGDDDVARYWELDRRDSAPLPDYWLGGLTPSQAEGLYLSRHWELIK